MRPPATLKMLVLLLSLDSAACTDAQSVTAATGGTPSTASDLSA